ncbi:MAG: tetratricopeptide repeat protein [Casimicrobiaceae bacterium]
MAKKRHPPGRTSELALHAPTTDGAGSVPAVSRSVIGTLVGISMIAVAVGAWFWHPWTSHPPPAVAATAAPAPNFVGSKACANCHEGATKAWSGSQHARAMQEATDATVLGDFTDRKFEHLGSSTVFSRRDGKFYVRTDGPDGKAAEFEVKYTFGLEPLQQYLIELPGARLQALTVAWDTGAKRWFSLYPKEKISAHDELHWTGRQQNWNFMCADCHSTDLRKNYDAAAGKFATTWSEIHVGCEACHGPGSNHIVWADKRTGDPRKGLTVALDERADVRWTIDPATGNATRSKPRESDREIEVCAQCHARRAQIAENYQAGKPFLDHYVPALLTPPLYHADGQQRDEAYIWASFLQSKMYRQGVTCSDCHEPHSQKLKAPGNALCAQCHAAEKYDSQKHHFHPAATAGAQCVNCHMPATTYMVVDPRRDHSLRVPRPDLSVSLGVPNACNSCHDTKDAKWAADTVRQWYGHDAQGLQNFAPTFRNAELGKPGAGASLAAVAADASQPAIARASALERLRTSPTSTMAAAASSGARSANPLQRLAAVRLAATLPPNERPAIAGPLLGDPLRAIRIEAASALVGIPEDQLSPEQRPALRRATDEYIAAQKYNADRPEARTNLGTFYSQQRRYDDAQAEFLTARTLDPRYVPAYVNSADAYRQRGRDDDAMRVLREGIAQVPASAPLHHALGLAFARQQQRDAALPELSRAAQLAPDSARYTYVYAVALNSVGRASDAIKTLQRAAERWPAERDIHIALATMERDAGHRDAARKAVQALVTADPSDREARALLDQLK